MLIKTYLRYTLEQEKHSELALISIKEEVTLTIDFIQSIYSHQKIWEKNVLLKLL